MTYMSIHECRWTCFPGHTDELFPGEASNWASERGQSSRACRFPKDLLGSRGAQLLHLRFCTKKRPYAARAIAGKRALIAKT
jgi:hypothetical protein